MRGTAIRARAWRPGRERRHGWSRTRVRIIACGLWFIFCSGAAAAQSQQEKAWGIIQTGTADHRRDERVAAVRALGLLRDTPRAEALAEKALKDRKAAVRAAAAVALGQMGAQRSIPLLKDALGDRESRVYFAAANSLLLLGDSEGYDVYYEVLTGERKTGENCTTQYKRMFENPKELAYFGLGIGVGFIPYAGYPWAVLQIVAKNYHAPVEVDALNRLATDPDPRIGKALVKAISDRSQKVRVAALEAIAQHGDMKLISAVTPYMNDKNAAVKCTAAAAVLRLSSLAPAECATQALVESLPAIPSNPQQ